MERYVAGRWDDNSFNVFDREDGNKAVGSPWGYMNLDDAQEAARQRNEVLHREYQHRGFVASVKEPAENC